MLSGIRSYSKNEIMERLEISTRNFYRYIKTLKDSGFVIYSKSGRYIIEKNNKSVKDISSLLHFNEEESHILNEAINSIEATTKARENLINKLAALYDNDRIAIRFVAKEQSSKIKPLLDGIGLKKQVIIKEYSSSAGGKINDRIVEPFDFTPNYILLWAYEPSSGKNKLFRVERMKKVEVTDINWQFEKQHKADIVDCFRMAGKTQMKVTFDMSLLAKNLLTEEFPLSEKFISQKDDNLYRFNGWVVAKEGLGRFVLGLPGEIFNLKNKEIENYIKENLKKTKNYFSD